MTNSVFTTISRIDLCYLAGIIDIKGAFSKKHSPRRKSGPQLTLYIESKEYPIIAKISKLTGVSPEMVAEKPLSAYLRSPCTEHCPEPHDHVQPETVVRAKARWTASGASAGVILHNVSPYLRTNRGWSEFYQECLDVAPTLVGSGLSAPLKALRRLDNLGWIFPPEYLELKNKIDEDP